MYYELYVDVFFMVNFTMDAILLILLKKLLACPAGYGRVFAGAATGAAMTCIAIVIRRGSMFFLLAVISYYLVSVIWKIILFFSEKGNRYCEVEVFFGEKNDRLRGLIDTGNTLSDAISNDPVSIIDRASVRRLTEEKKPERFRYISYHSIGKKEGVMPAFRLDKMQIIRDGNKINVEHQLVAVIEEELGSENYQMIINPDILAGGKKNGDKSGSSTSV